MMLEPQKDLFENMQGEIIEHYRFQFDPDQVTPVEKAYVSVLVKRMVLFIVVCVALMAIGFWCGELLIAAAVGMLYIGVVDHIKIISAYKKIYAKGKKKYLTSVYDYTLYSNYLMIWISSKNAIRQMRVGLNEITKAQVIGAFVVLEIDNQLFLLKKEELAANSYFLSICKTK